MSLGRLRGPGPHPGLSHWLQSPPPPSVIPAAGPGLWDPSSSTSLVHILVLQHSSSWRVDSQLDKELQAGVIVFSPFPIPSQRPEDTAGAHSLQLTLQDKATSYLNTFPRTQAGKLLCLENNSIQSPSPLSLTRPKLSSLYLHLPK